MSEKRGAWYLLTGLVLGLALGLAYSLWISPIEYARIAPQSLGSGYKDTYRVLIALAYDANGDIGRAQARLSLLKDDDPAGALAAHAQRLMAEGGSSSEARALASLSDALLAHLAASPTVPPTSTEAAQETPKSEIIQTQPPTATIDPERAILTPTNQIEPGQTDDAPIAAASITPRSTPLPAALTNASFEVAEKREVCEMVNGISDSGPPLLQVEVLDQDGLPLPGIPILVSWEGGEDRFFTGLHPQVSPGYADFEMQPDVEYSVQAGSRGQIETGITSIYCTGEEGETYAGALWLTFVQP